MSNASWEVNPNTAGALTPGQSELWIESISKLTKISFGKVSRIELKDFKTPFFLIWDNQKIFEFLFFKYSTWFLLHWIPCAPNS